MVASRKGAHMQVVGPMGVAEVEVDGMLAAVVHTLVVPMLVVLMLGIELALVLVAAELLLEAVVLDDSTAATVVVVVL